MGVVFRQPNGGSRTTASAAGGAVSGPFHEPIRHLSGASSERFLWRIHDGFRGGFQRGSGLDSGELGDVLHRLWSTSGRPNSDSFFVPFEVTFAVHFEVLRGRSRTPNADAFSTPFRALRSGPCTTSAARFTPRCRSPLPPSSARISRSPEGPARGRTDSVALQSGPLRPDARARPDRFLEPLAAPSFVVRRCSFSELFPAVFRPSNAPPARPDARLRSRLSYEERCRGCSETVVFSSIFTLSPKGYRGAFAARRRAPKAPRAMRFDRRSARPEDAREAPSRNIRSLDPRFASRTSGMPGTGSCGAFRTKFGFGRTRSEEPSGRVRTTPFSVRRRALLHVCEEAANDRFLAPRGPCFKPPFGADFGMFHDACSEDFGRTPEGPQKGLDRPRVAHGSLFDTAPSTPSEDVHSSPVGEPRKDSESTSENAPSGTPKTALDTPFGRAPPTSLPKGVAERLKPLVKPSPSPSHGAIPMMQVG